MGWTLEKSLPSSDEIRRPEGLSQWCPMMYMNYKRNKPKRRHKDQSSYKLGKYFKLRRENKILIRDLNVTYVTRHEVRQDSHKYD